MNHLEYLFERGLIGSNKMQLSEDDSEGLKIAKALGIRFVGFWKDIGKYLFNDDGETGTSFVAKDMEEAKNKLRTKRKEFGLSYAS